MDVDEGGAPIRNPKAESHVLKLPAIDGAKMRTDDPRSRDGQISGAIFAWIALFMMGFQRSFIGQLP